VTRTTPATSNCQGYNEAGVGPRQVRGSGHRKPL
jgi:hypothetical protein